MKAAPLCPVSHIASIGQNCSTSFVLKSQGLKRWSGPFDWIFSTLGLVLDCMEDDFAALLDPAQYEPVPVERREDPNINRCHHALFRERHGIHHLFNHYDPSEPGDLAYLRRCVERFRRMLEGPGRAVLFGLYHRDTLDMAAFNRLAALLDRRWPNAELLLVVVADPVAPFDTGFSLRRTAGRHAIVDMRPFSRWGGLQFEGPEDAVLIRQALHRLPLDLLPQEALS